MLVEVYYYYDPEFGIELSFSPRYEDGWIPVEAQRVKFVLTRSNGYKFIVDTLADALAEMQDDPKIQINAIYYPDKNQSKEQGMFANIPF